MMALPVYDTSSGRLYYRKEKLRGASWEYEINGGWFTVPTDAGDRRVLRHGFRFYRPREVTITTPEGPEVVRRSYAEQWFFPDRWFSLLRFIAEDHRTIGYYVNFSQPLREIRTNYYSDIDLELDLWLDLDGKITELDRDEYEAEIEANRLAAEWVEHVEAAAVNIHEAVASCLEEFGPDLEAERHPVYGIPEFILRA